MNYSCHPTLALLLLLSLSVVVVVVVVEMVVVASNHLYHTSASGNILSTATN